jgi:hypothetical protein
LVAVKSSTGEHLWKVGLGRDLVQHAAETLCFDSERVYIPADGILRAYTLATGKVEWESAVGPPNQAWKSCLRGDSVIVHPAQSLPKTGSTMTVCEASSGHFRQRLTFKHPSGNEQPANLNLFSSGPTLLFACSGTLVGLEAPK